MSANNSLLLRVDGLEPVGSGAFADHMWAAPSVAHLRTLMRDVVRDPGAAQRLGAQARADMVRHDAGQGGRELMQDGVWVQVARFSLPVIGRQLQARFAAAGTQHHH
jgi:hypothetical protein